MEQSARAIDAMQSTAQPAVLNLNLYGNAGLCISSCHSWVMLYVISRVSIFDHSHRDGPTQQLGVLNAEPEPPRSQPRDENSAKSGSRFSVVVPRRIKSPVEPCRLVRPLPYLS